MHAFAYGVPVCTHDQMAWQKPEVEIIEEGKTGFFFGRNDREDMTKKIVEWFVHNEKANITRDRCIDAIERHYNPTSQARIIQDFVKNRCSSRR